MKVKRKLLILTSLLIVIAVVLAVYFEDVLPWKERHPGILPLPQSLDHERILYEHANLVSKLSESFAGTTHQKARTLNSQPRKGE